MANNLNNIIEEMNTLNQKLRKILLDIPKNQTCAYSNFSNALWCELLDNLALYSRCESCPKYASKYGLNNDKN
jgi:hypothetical protein